MLITCWSPKGGAGTTVVAAALARLASARHEDGALLVDLAGDAPAVLGLREPEGPGLAGWLAVGEAPVDALDRLEVPAAAGLALLARGSGPLATGRGPVLAALLAADPRRVIADCGTAPQGPAADVVAVGDRSLLVTRPCFVALRRALAAPLRPTGVVLVDEPSRSLTRADVEAALGVPVVAVVQVDPAVARAVDAGLLASRLPRTLARELRDVV
jgi:MinD-like ATPase involved in chromosome partitioning or flagellar assembly